MNMGFLKKLKDLFNKNIECGDEINDHIVYLSKKKYLYLHKNIYVKEQTACVIVYKGRVCDVVFAGKYRINHDSIPETYGKAKIEKNTSKGKKIKRIKASIYFVNLETSKQFAYMSDAPFKSKTSTFGRVKGCLAGTCSIKVLDAGGLIKVLISQGGKIKTKDVVDKIGLLIGNKINRIIQKEKIPLEMLLNNQEYVERIVNTEIQDALDKEGLFVSNVKLKAVDFNKKNKSKVNEYLSNRPNGIKHFDINATFGTGGTLDNMVTIQTRSPSVSQNSAMQNLQKTSNIQQFIVCNKCHKKNGTNARICINCGNKLN